MPNESTLGCAADEPAFVEKTFSLTGVPATLETQAVPGSPEPAGAQLQSDRPFNCLVVGVGGQGAVLASRLVAAACMDGGSFVRTAETIGMSQRGGSVATHVRAAPTARDLPTSMIPRRGADLVLALEPGEAVRAYGYLACGGALVCSTRPLVPSAAATSGYDGRAQVDWLAEHVGPERFAALDVQALEDAGLSPKCLNVLLLGAAVGLGALPFGADELRRAMAELMKPKLIPMNERALELGISLVG